VDYWKSRTLDTSLALALAEHGEGIAVFVVVQEQHQYMRIAAELSLLLPRFVFDSTHHI